MPLNLAQHLLVNVVKEDLPVQSDEEVLAVYRAAISGFQHTDVRKHLFELVELTSKAKHVY